MKKIIHNLKLIANLELFLFNCLVEDTIHYYIFDNISTTDTLVNIISEQLQKYLGENSEIY